MSEKRPLPDRVQLPDWLRDARRGGVLGPLPDHLVAAIVRGGHCVMYPAGTILPEPELGPWAAIVLRGSVRAYLPAPDGAQITLRYLKPADPVGTLVCNQHSLVRSLLAL